MFTGIVEHAGRLEQITQTGAGAQLTVALGPVTEGVRLGDSIAINGVCLTVTSLESERATFDAVAETLKRTTLGEKHAGDQLNLERATRVGDRLGGHIMQGHIDGVARVSRIVRQGDACEMHFSCEENLTREMVHKGSVAIDGVSLTLAGVLAEGFHVALIPTTLKATTLGTVKEGDRVNIETDVLGKYVIKLLNRMMATEKTGTPDGITQQFLSEHGFT